MYNSANNPCFHGDSLVSLADGTTKPVRALQRGDEVRTSLTSPSSSARVLCVLQTVLLDQPARDPSAGAGPLVDLVAFPGGLKVTPWHPVRLNGEWVFPARAAMSAGAERHGRGDSRPSVPRRHDLPCDALYSFLLAPSAAREGGEGRRREGHRRKENNGNEAQTDSAAAGLEPRDLFLSAAASEGAHSLVIDGIECVALGHMLETADTESGAAAALSPVELEVVAHPFWSRRRGGVGEALANMKGWEEGHVLVFNCAGTDV